MQNHIRAVLCVVVLFSIKCCSILIPVVKLSVWCHPFEGEVRLPKINNRAAYLVLAGRDSLAYGYFQILAILDM